MRSWHYLLFVFLFMGMNAAMGCAMPTSALEEYAPEGTARRVSPPDGLEVWLAQQCPDGAALAVEDIGAGQPIRSVACESLREKALADPPTRDRLARAYTMQTESPAEDPIGTAREPLSPVGALVCGLIATTPDLVFNFGPTGAAACHNPRLSHAEQMRCHNVTAGGSIVLSILCGLAAVFL